jgi:hypothetical protein
MTDKQYGDIISRLDKIVGLLAVQGKERDMQIKILSSLNFSSLEIEDLTGTPSRTVRGVISKKGKKK